MRGKRPSAVVPAQVRHPVTDLVFQCCVCGESESPNRVIKCCVVKPDELITGRQMGPRGIVGAEEHGDNVDISRTHTHTQVRRQLGPVRKH